MAHDHHHHTDGPAEPAPRRTRLALALVLVPVGIVTLVAMAVMWPHERTTRLADPNAMGRTGNLDATVTGIDERECAAGTCTTVRVRLTEGPDAGREVSLERMQGQGEPGAPALHVGKPIVVSRVELVLEPGVITYNYAGPQRHTPLWLLGAAFVVAVIAVARWRGVAALAGLAITYAILIVFVIPAIINGENPVAVALTGSTAAMYLVLYLAHGCNVRTSTALLGTLASLGLIGALAWLFVGLADLTGTASEEVMFIQAAGANLNLRGLLLAGVIIGSMGVLNDVTVTQASAVWEIHRADPTRPVRQRYHAGMRVGRDHIASVVDTLVLAYAGASLPLMILFVIGNQHFGDVVTGEVVAEEIVRTLVGSIGLVASVPLTTLAATIVVTHQPPPDDETASTAASTVEPVLQQLGETVRTTTASLASRAAEQLDQRRQQADQRADLRARRQEAERATGNPWTDDA